MVVVGADLCTVQKHVERRSIVDDEVALVFVGLIVKGTADERWGLACPRPIGFCAFLFGFYAKKASDFSEALSGNCQRKALRAGTVSSFDRELCGEA